MKYGILRMPLEGLFSSFTSNGGSFFLSILPTICGEFIYEGGKI